MDGKCLCGKITLSTPDRSDLDACHCGMCRRWGGGPALMIACGSAVQIDGVDRLKMYNSCYAEDEKGFRDCHSK